MFRFATGVNAHPDNAALLLLTLVRGARSIYVACEEPVPPETVQTALGALTDALAQNASSAELVPLLATAVEALNVYFEAPVEIDLVVCRKGNGPALVFGPAETGAATAAATTAAAGTDATQH